MNPPVSILNLVPHSVPLLIVNTWEKPLPQFKYSLGVYLAGSQSVYFPKILGVDSPITCVKAASYNCSGILKKLLMLSHSIALMVLPLSGPDSLCLLYLFMKQFCHCIKYPFLKLCWTKILNIFSNCDASIFGLGLLVTLLGLVIFVPWLLILVLPWFLVKVLFTFVMMLFVPILPPCLLSWFPVLPQWVWVTPFTSASTISLMVDGTLKVLLQSNESASNIFLEHCSAI